MGYDGLLSQSLPLCPFAGTCQESNLETICMASLPATIERLPLPTTTSPLFLRWALQSLKLALIMPIVVDLCGGNSLESNPDSLNTKGAVDVSSLPVCSDN